MKAFGFLLCLVLFPALLVMGLKQVAKPQAKYGGRLTGIAASLVGGMGTAVFISYIAGIFYGP